MMKRGAGPPNPPKKRKSSLGLRSFMNNTGLEDGANDLLSSANRLQSVSRIPFGSSRIPRVPNRDPGGSSRRSSSYEAFSRRSGTTPQPEMHFQNVGLLLTPVRPTPSRSPSVLSMASNCRQSTFGNAMRMPMPLSIPTSSKVRDSRPIQDKQFQADALAKITYFLKERGVNVKLKPMSSGVVITTFNTIISLYDKNLQVVSSNYVDKIQTILAELEYPTTISKSSFIAPGTGHASAQLIAMFVWLLDAGQVKIDQEKLFFPKAEFSEDEKVMKASIKTLFASYREFKRKGPISDEDFYDTFCENMGVSRDEERQLQEQIKELKEKVAILKNDPHKQSEIEKIAELDRVEEEAAKIENEVDELNDKVKLLKLKSKEQNEHIKCLDMDINRLDDQASELHDQIEIQPMKAAERDEIRSECERLRQEIENKEEYCIKLDAIISKSDIELAQTTKEMQNIIQDVNCIVLDNRMDEIMAWDQNSVYDITHEYPKFKLDQWSNYYQSLMKNMELLENNKKLQVKEIESLKQALESFKSDIVTKKREIIALQQESKNYVELMEKKQKEFEEKTRLEVERGVKLREKVATLPKIDDLETKIRETEKKKEEASLEFANYKTFIETQVFPYIKLTYDEVHDELLEGIESINQEVASVVQKINQNIDDIVGKNNPSHNKESGLGCSKDL